MSNIKISFSRIDRKIKKWKNDAYKKAAADYNPSSGYSQAMERALFEEYAFARKTYEGLKSYEFGKRLLWLETLQKYGKEWLQLPIPKEKDHKSTSRKATYNRHSIQINADAKDWAKNIQSIKGKMKALEACRKLVPQIAAPIISVTTESERLKLVTAKLNLINDYLDKSTQASVAISPKPPSLIESDKYVNELKKIYEKQKSEHELSLGDTIPDTKIEQVYTELDKAIIKFNTDHSKSISERADIDLLLDSKQKLQELIKEWKNQLKINDNPSVEKYGTLGDKITNVELKLKGLEAHVSAKALVFAQTEYELAKAKGTPFKQKLTKDNVDILHAGINDFWAAYDEYQRQVDVFTELPEGLKAPDKELQTLRVLAGKVEVVYELYKVIDQKATNYQANRASMKDNYQERGAQIKDIMTRISKFQEIVKY